MQLYILDTEGFFYPRLIEGLTTLKPDLDVTILETIESVADAGGFALINPACMMPGKSIQQSLMASNANISYGILSDPLPFEWVQRMFKEGASGYFPKNMDIDALVQAIIFTMTTSQYFLPIDRADKPSYYMQRVGVEDVAKQDGFIFQPHSQGAIDFDLSKRERQVAEKIAEGMTNARIATVLDIKEVTVKQHASAIYKKLGVNNRTQALRLLMPLLEKRHA
jgi:DNA-binding NarL/FixJ family response regulator